MPLMESYHNENTTSMQTLWGRWSSDGFSSANPYMYPNADGTFYFRLTSGVSPEHILWRRSVLWKPNTPVERFEYGVKALITTKGATNAGSGAWACGLISPPTQEYGLGTITTNFVGVATNGFTTSAGMVFGTPMSNIFNGLLSTSPQKMFYTSYGNVSIDPYQPRLLDIDIVFSYINGPAYGVQGSLRGIIKMDNTVVWSSDNLKDNGITGVNAIVNNGLSPCFMITAGGPAEQTHFGIMKVDVK